MGIYVRRGMEADFDPEKMKPGEWAVSINTDRRKQKIWMCFAPGVVKRMGTYEDFADQIEDATDEIKNKYLETFNEILKDMKTNKDLVETDYNFVKEFKELLENTYMQEIAASVKAASSSAASASTSASSASQSATAAADSADEAESYAASWKGSLLPQGVVAFSELPTSGLVAGHLYAVKDKFITDSRFEEGAGHPYPQGTCVYWTKDNKWKVLSGVLSLELTRAEYDALTDAQKKNGTIYYVKDADNLIEADEINGLAVVATSGNYNDLKNKPSSLPASDVSDWAKAKTKPSYSAGEVGLGNVGNFKAVSTVSSQGLSDAEKSNARANIGAQAAGSYATSTHTHDDRYYTESETDTKLKEKLSAILKGSANGLAELDSTGKVPASQLPSFVDDVIEGYLYNGKLYKESGHTTEISGESGKIYVDLSTEKTYRWSGSTFVVISDTLALGETSTTAYRGDRGKAAYEHSQSAHARTDATKTEASATNGNLKINGNETQVYRHPAGTNPHGTTKADVGLDKVGNFKAVSTVSGQGLSDAEKNNARTNIGAQAAGTYLTEHQDISGKLDNTATGANSLLSNLTASWTAAPTDDTNFIRQDTGGKSEFGRVKFSTLWTFIKGKADKVYSAIGHKHIKADITDFPTSMAANGGDSSTVNGHTVNSNVPANAKFTDTNTWRPQPDWNATSGDAVIKNKPTIPSVGNGTVTITQNGISKGIFTMNQSGNTTIALTDTNTTYSVATTSANGLMSKDMVTKLNNITSGANAVIQVLTASQYNALSEAQKKNGTIYLVN